MSSLGELTVPKVEQTGPTGDAEFVYVDISSIDNQAKRIVDPKRLTPAAAPSRARQRLRKGDVLVSMTRPNLNAVAIVTPDLDGAIGSTGFHVLRANDDVEPHWLYYAVQSNSFVKAMCDLVQGALYPAVRPKDIREYAISRPPLATQREIVAELEKQLSRLDEAVANLQRVKANLKRYKASVLKAAVEGRLVETEATLARREGRTFETGEQLLQRILEERRAKWRGKGRYKEPVAQTAEFTIAVTDGWTSATVDQLASVQLGKMLDKQKHKAGEPYRYLRNINVRWGTFDVSDVFEMNFESDELERFSVRAGDVLVCEGGEPARAAVWRAKQTDMKYQKALHRVRFDGAYLPDLIVIALEHLAKSGALDELYGGSTIKHFTRETFVKLVLPVPPAAEQARIVAEVDRHLSIIREVEVEVEANLQRAQALRQATLAKAFANT